MRVLIVEHKEIFGGGQIALLNLLRAWQAQRAEIEPLVVCSPRAALGAHVRALGVACTTMELGAIEKTRGAAWNAIQRVVPTMRLWNIVRAFQPDVILANCAYSFLASMFAATLSRTPIVWFEQTTTLPNGRMLAQMLYRADVIVTASRAIRDQFIALAPDTAQKISVLYNGVDTTRFMPRAPTQTSAHALTIGTVSRLSPEKGIEFFIAAANEFAPGHPETRFVIAGDGPERASLQARANAAFSFLGAQENIPAVLETFDIFVMPSLAEGFGIAAVEAMACGLPVIASDVGGLREVVVPDETGLLVPPADAAALGNAFELLGRDENKRAVFGAQGRARVMEHFTAASQARRWQLVLENARRS